MRWNGRSLMLVFAAAFAGFTAAAFFTRGIPRNAYIVYYKIGRVRQGSLQYREHWGWVDHIHYQVARERLELLDRLLTSDPPSIKTVSLEGRFRTALGGWITVRKRYRILPGKGLTDGERKAVGAGIVMDMAYAEESAQEHGRFWQGTDISAFQFDDLPSTWLACLEHLRMRPPEPESASALRLIQEGFALAAQRVAFPPDFSEQARPLHRLTRATRMVRGHWKRA